MKSKTLEDIKRRLALEFGDLVTLADNQTYTRMIDPLIFIDRDYGEWKTSPNNVLNKKCTHPKRKLIKRKETTLKIYGVDNVFKHSKIKEKRKKTMIEKHGSEHPIQVEAIKQKIQETCFKKYNAKTPLNSPEIQNKIKTTLLERYNVDNSFKSPEIREKIQQTFLDKYGYDNPQKAVSVKEKTRKTCIQKYGGVAPACNNEIQEKIAQTNIDRYGGIAPLCDTKIQDKVKQTNLSRYGVENPFANKNIQEKIANIFIEKYGVYNNDNNKAFRKYTHILPNNKSLINYLEEFNKTDHYSACLKIYKKHGFDILKEYIEGGKNFLQISSLEEVTSKLLNLSKCTEKIGRRKPDFKLNETTFLEVDGLYWHSDRIRNNDYHFKKRIEYENQKFRLFQFRANEIEQQPDIVLAIINSFLGKTERINASQCTIELVSDLELKKFLNKNHIQGNINSPHISIGLYYENKLYMVVCTKQQNTSLEITRICTLNGFTIIQGFEKILEYIEQNLHISLIYTWCDLRYDNGSIFKDFKHIDDILDWSWTDLLNVYPQHTKIETEKLYRIYGAGQRLFVKMVNFNLDL